MPVEPLESIDDAISHLAANLALLSHYIKANAENLTVDEMARLCTVLGQNLSRFVRMHRDRVTLEGPLDDALEADIAEALRLAGERLGVDLT